VPDAREDQDAIKKRSSERKETSMPNTPGIKPAEGLALYIMSALGRLLT
jgi:hypothetical protein